MAQRRLTKQQRERISRQQKARAEKLHENEPAPDENGLGPEQEGLVITQYGKQVDVESAGDPGHVQRCFLRANLGSVVSGDRVIWRDSDRGGVVVSVLPRRTELVRPDSFGNLRVVAANVDRMLITLAPQPEPHRNLIDRYLVVAETLGLTPVILVNKKDLSDSGKSSPVRDILSSYQRLGYNLLEVSAHTGHGMAQLRELLSHGTSIFVGQSGAGKSSIVQKLLPGEDIKIGELSEQVQKGRHTTTHSRLYHFPDGGCCIDSPGIREFGLWHMTPDQIAAGFRELQPLLGSCRFRNCSHTTDPGCALQAAVAEGEIERARFDSYRHIVDSLDSVEVRQP